MKNLLYIMREQKENNLSKMTPLFFFCDLPNLTHIAELCKGNLVKRRGKRASQMGRLFFFCSLIPLMLLSCTATKKVSDSAALKKDKDQRLTESTVNINDIKAHIHYLAADEMKGREDATPLRPNSILLPAISPHRSCVME